MHVKEGDRVLDRLYLHRIWIVNAVLVSPHVHKTVHIVLVRLPLRFLAELDQQIVADSKMPCSSSLLRPCTKIGVLIVLMRRLAMSSVIRARTSAASRINMHSTFRSPVAGLMCAVASGRSRRNSCDAGSLATIAHRP